LQTAVGPTILISGTGLLLLSMTNRLGRTIDRARALSGRDAEARARVEGQIAVLWKRAKLLRASILLTTASALCAAILIIDVFLSAALGFVPAWSVAAIFSVGMLLLIAALVLFIKDVNLSLHALEAELRSRP
jgi:hypothetical protein